MKIVHLGGAAIALHDNGLTVTHCGRNKVEALAQNEPEYRQRAIDLGYGADTARMSREHELGHSLLAHWLGLTISPTLYALMRGTMWPDWRREEAAVLGLQGYARAANVDLEALATKLSRQD